MEKSATKKGHITLFIHVDGCDTHTVTIDCQQYCILTKKKPSEPQNYSMEPHGSLALECPPLIHTYIYKCLIICSLVCGMYVGLARPNFHIILLYVSGFKKRVHSHMHKQFFAAWPVKRLIPIYVRTSTCFVNFKCQ